MSSRELDELERFEDGYREIPITVVESSAVQELKSTTASQLQEEMAAEGYEPDRSGT